jgi:DNA methyltransferase 1-associated protein 1
MSEDLKDILGVSRNGLGDKPEPKEKKEKAKRPEGMSREAFALLGDAHPIIASHNVSNLVKQKANAAKPKPLTKGTTTYLWKPFTNPARTDELELYHWVRCIKDASGRVRDAEEGEYPYAKFNKKV